MNLPTPFRQLALAHLHRAHIDHRPADFTIGPPNDSYLQRWYIVRHGHRWRAQSTHDRAMHLRTHNPRQDHASGLNIYAHRFLRSDDDRALHDHPWRWRTIILHGEYIEHVPADPTNPAGPTLALRRRAGHIGRWRWGAEAHRVELINNQPVTTLFITSAKEREWGFWCTHGWRHWRDFTAPHNSGQIGRGCE